jgi:hypothetical protein
MPWLWIVPIVFSGLLDHGSQSRKWSVVVYTLLSSFIFSGTVIFVVPHHVTFGEMLFATLIPWGPMNLLIAFAVEKVSQRLFRSFRIWGNTGPNVTITRVPIRTAFLAVTIVGLAVAFPFTYRAVAFQAAREAGRANAERDWAQGKALWYTNRSDPAMFGASGDGCYSVANGLMTEMMKPGVTATVYCEAYRAVVVQKFAQSGPADKVKDLSTEAELQTWIKGGRFRRVESFPLKQCSTEISLRGYKISSGGACFRGEPSKFLYSAIIPEKKNALVVISDDSIWIFAESGQLLQSVDYETYQQMGITEDVLLAHR